ncbi:MAG: protein tyrosine phosphatase family protein [Candidatus Latescibacteria bacterium]|jgi:uncharacterized protein (TIGR01244 family)|nr:protein tyrosine phosphatase family protein [Candidatus Latescibacterota bacterium]
MRFFRLSVVAGIVIPGLLLNGCSDDMESPQKTARTHSGEATIETTTLGNTRNVHKFGDVYFAGQPSEADFEEVKKAGVKTVINLRMPNEVSWDEKQVVNDLGMVYHNIPFDSPDLLTDVLFDELRGLLNKTENQPVMLHCASANRVGAMWLAYRAVDGGLSYKDALDEAKTVGLRSKSLEVKAKDYIERHKFE